MRLLLLLFLLALTLAPSSAQQAKDNDDAFFIRKIYDYALTQGQCYPWLHHLTIQIGGRLSGSAEVAAVISTP